MTFAYSATATGTSISGSISGITLTKSLSYNTDGTSSGVAYS